MNLDRQIICLWRFLSPVKLVSPNDPREKFSFVRIYFIEKTLIEGKISVEQIVCVPSFVPVHIGR